ncbi:MAG TPA: GDSL-type esterase/lipase family protein [Anaerolineae bacterium]
MKDETAFAIDFNLYQVPAALGLPVPPAAAAALLGIGEQELLDYSRAAGAEVAAAAAGLAANPGIAAGLAALRANLADGARILAIGDSITTYRRGYVALLAGLLASCYPQAGYRVINVGQSGYTSTQARECTYTQWLAQQPDLACVMYGVNDCKRFGGGTATLVSVNEYAANMKAIVEALLTHTRAQVVLFTPTPIVTAVANQVPDFVAMRMTWSNADIAACAEAVRAIAAGHGLPCVDLVAGFGPAPDPALYLPDGLHPGPSGHRMILERFLETVAQRRKA